MRESISDWWTRFVSFIAGRMTFQQDRRKKIIPCKVDEEQSQSFSCEDEMNKQPKKPSTDSYVASELRCSPIQIKGKGLKKTESVDSCSSKSGYNDEFIITIKTHKDMPRLSKAKHLRVDTSYSYYDDCDNSSYSSFSIAPYSVMESEYSKSPSSLQESFQCAKTYYDDCADASYMLDTAEVSYCPSACGDSLPTTPVINTQSNKTNSNNNNNTELFPQTPACSPVAGLSCKPVPKSVKCGNYQGMFRTNYKAGTGTAQASSKVQVLVDAFIQ